MEMVILPIAGGLFFVGLLYLIVEFGVPSLILKLTEFDTGWSPYRMRASSGDVVMVSKGRSDGPFAFILPSDIPGWHYYRENERFYKEGTPDFKVVFPNGLPKSDGYLAKIGATYVGFFRRYYRRRRKWENWEFNSATKKWELVDKSTRQGEDDHIFHFSTTMAIRVANVYTKDFYPVSFTIIFNVLLINPRKAEFVAGKWEVQANASVLSRAREYVGGRTIHQLRAERDSSSKQDFVDWILRANDKQAGETNTIALLEEFGVMIQGPQMVEPDFESGDKEMNDAIQRKMIAGEDLETAKIKAKEKEQEGIGLANRRKAEAVGIREEYAARTSVPEGATLSWAEAVRESKPDVIALGSNFPIALPAKSGNTS